MELVGQVIIISTISGRGGHFEWCHLVLNLLPEVQWGLPMKKALHEIIVAKQQSSSLKYSGHFCLLQHLQLFEDPILRD